MSSDDKLDEIIRRLGLLETGIKNLGIRGEVLENNLEALIIESRKQWNAFSEQLTDAKTDIQSDICKLQTA
jgi:hypothetical protein